MQACACRAERLFRGGRLPVRRTGRSAPAVRRSTRACGSTQQPPREPGRFARLSASGRAALFTGAYISVAGVALMLAPRTCFGLLFKSTCAAHSQARRGYALF